MIIISSKDNDNGVSDAENALQHIASLILKVISFFLTIAVDNALR